MQDGRTFSMVQGCGIEKHNPSSTIVRYNTGLASSIYASRFSGQSEHPNSTARTFALAEDPRPSTRTHLIHLRESPVLRTTQMATNDRAVASTCTIRAHRGGAARSRAVDSRPRNASYRPLDVEREEFELTWRDAEAIRVADCSRTIDEKDHRVLAVQQGVDLLMNAVDICAEHSSK